MTVRNALHEGPVIAIRWLVALFLFSFSITQMLAQTGGSLACNDLVQVSLDSDCEAEIYPDIVLEGTYDPSTQWQVQISNVTGTIVSTPGLYTVTITDLGSGNSCWGEILVEDKLAPSVDDCNCPVGNTDANCDFFCTDKQGIIDGTFLLPQPTVTEACGPIDTTVTDVYTDGTCGQQILTRTLVFTDVSGNSSTCTQEFRLNPVDFNDVMRPVTPVSLGCGSDYAPEDILAHYTPLVGLATARTYAYPTVNGMPIDGQVCNIMASYTDQATPACGAQCDNSFKVIRRYVILDWCNGDIDEFNQLIDNKDNTPPVIEAADITTSVDPWGCLGTVTFDPPTTLSDACSATVDYRVMGPAGVTVSYNATTDRWTATDVPLGTTEFRYVGSDCCDNESVDTITVTVADLSAPVAVAKQNIVVSLTSAAGDGQAKIFANSVDNGSYDGCTDVYFELRRSTDNCDIEGNTTYNNDGHANDDVDDPDDGKFVKFCCEDLDQVDANGVAYGIVEVWLRVWDDGDRNGIYGTAGDNYNETWASVRVDDKLPPQISCPADVTLQCYDDIDDLSVAGSASASRTCGGLDVDYFDVSDQRDNCGYGFVVRRWFVVGAQQVQCEQIITIPRTNLFDGDITWPADTSTTCVDLAVFGEPTWTAPACASVGYSIQSDTFQFVDDVCYKILNQYTVIDWCQFDSSNPYYGKWQHTQVIKVEDEDAPVLAMCQDTMFATNDHSDADDDGDTCEAIGLVISNVATDEGACPSNRLRGCVTLDVDHITGPDYEFTTGVSPSDSEFDDDDMNGIPDIYLAPTMSGEEVFINIPEDIAGPMSTIKVHWTVTDGCGNRRSCHTTVMVVDKKPPTPYCVSLSTALMDVTGMVELWAIDFNVGSFDNCTAADDLLYTFNNAVPVPTLIDVPHFFTGNGVQATAADHSVGIAQRWDPTSNTSGLVFTCDDVPLANVVMTVHDSKGNSDFCEVTLTITDNSGVCDGIGSRLAVQGSVLSDDGMPIEGAEIKLDPGINDLDIITMTDDNGNYAFNDVVPGFNYTISAEFDDAYDNGVSTLDLVLIQRHILGISTLDNAYDAIAADINSSENVTGADVVALRKLILGVTDDMAGNTSWLFLDAGQSFVDANNPWPVSYATTLPNLQQNASKDLVAIKVGDVNGSASNGLAGSDQLDSRSVPMTIYLEEATLVPGEQMTIPVYAASDAEVHGLQASIALGDMTVVDLIPGVLDVSTADIALTDGGFKMAYAAQRAAAVEINDVLFSMVVSSKVATQLSSQISINSDMRAEVYTGASIDIQLLELAISRSSDVATFELYQNQPNPFKEETMISFALPEAGDATLSVFDINGRVIYQNTAYFPQGKQAIMLDRSLVDASGVLYYRLESGDFVATRKMIQIQ